MLKVLIHKFYYLWNKGVNFPYRDYMYGLDKLSVFIEKDLVNIKYAPRERISPVAALNNSTIPKNTENVPGTELNKIINTISINHRSGKHQRRSKTSLTSFDETSMCNFVTRNNYALFTSSIHLECSKPLVGRYIYIQMDGRNNRWSRLFSAVFCEIQAYEV